MDTPKSSILIGFSIINHPFWGIPIFGNTQVEGKTSLSWSRDFAERSPEATFAQDGGGLPNSFLVLHATVPALKLVCIEVV